MANRYPLILDTSDSNKIKELPASDDLYLRNSNISEVQNITALGTISAAQLTIAGSAVFAQNFIELDDVPSTYSDAGGAVLKVNSAGTGIEFATLNNFGDLVVDNITMNNNITPETNNIGSVGSETNKFNKIYATDVYASIRGNDGTLILDATTNQISYALINGAPTSLSEFTNDTGFTTTADVQAEVATVLDSLNVGNVDITGSVFGDDSTILVDGVNNLLSTHRLDQVAATNGQVLTWSDSAERWEPETPTVGIQLASLSVSAPLTPFSNGGIQYNNTTGEFTYQPPDLSQYALITTLVDYVQDADLPAILSTITLDVVTDNNATTTNNISVGQLTSTNIISDVINLTPLTAEPASPTDGMIVAADRETWDPASKGSGRSYPVYYDGAVWQPLY